MLRHSRILSVGLDRDVLQARNSILISAGFQVGVARSRHEAVMAAASHRFDAVILCWTFSEQEQQRLIADLVTVTPGTRVLALSRPAVSTLPDFSDPGYLLQMIRATLPQDRPIAK